MKKGASMVHGVIRFLTVGTVLALVALLLHVSNREAFWSLSTLAFAAWIIGPTVTAYVLARRFKHRTWFPYVMLAFLAGFAVLSTLAYYDAFFVSKSSTAGLVMVMVPFYQWAALVIIGTASAGVAVWHDRRAARE